MTRNLITYLDSHPIVLLGIIAALLAGVGSVG